MFISHDPHTAAGCRVAHMTLCVDSISQMTACNAETEQADHESCIRNNAGPE